MVLYPYVMETLHAERPEAAHQPNPVIETYVGQHRQPTAAEATPPLYALDETAIRQRVADAIREQPPADRYPQIADIQPDGRVEDVEKARLLADFLDPYETARAKEEKELLEILHSMKLTGERIAEGGSGKLRDTALVLFNTLRHPFKMAKVFRKAWRAASYGRTAQDVTDIIGGQYDRMVAAALPFVQKLDVLDILPDAKSAKPSFAPPPEAQPLAETPISAEAETLAAQLKIDAQLQEQLFILQRAGIITQLQSGEAGIKTEDGELTAPTPQQIRRLIDTHRNLVTYKAQQGFTRLLIVPDLTTNTLGSRLQDRVMAHFKANNLRTAEGHPITTPTYDLENQAKSELVPNLDHLQDAHPSEKPSSIPGWKVLLVKNMPLPPRKPADIMMMGDRGEFLPNAITKDNVSPQDYERYLQTDSRLRGEVGMTMRAWIMYALTELEREGKLIDADNTTLLLGSSTPGRTFTKRRAVPTIGWHVDFNPSSKKPGSIALYVTAASPKLYRRHAAVRTAVELT